VSPAALEVMRVDSAREPTGMVGLVFGGVGRPLWIFHDLVTAAVAKQGKSPFILLRLDALRGLGILVSCDSISLHVSVTLRKAHTFVLGWERSTRFPERLTSNFTVD
jgi:hypothetical protein